MTIPWLDPHVTLVQFEDETDAKLRTVRLCSAAARVGDPILVEGQEGVIVAAPYAVLYVRRPTKQD